jgi:ATP-binding cassette subfamily F protein 3
MEILSGRKKADTGTRALGLGAELAFFGQDAGDELDADETVMDAIGRDAPFDQYPRLRGLLGAFLFSGDDIDKRVRVLSGGEKSRLALARLLLRPANLILLDEPTNHLDLRAKEVLMDAFRQFTGTLVFVAHDRYFMEDLPDRIVEVRNGKLTSYIGDYSDYLLAKEREELGAAGGGPAGPRPDRVKEPPPADKVERMQRREDDKNRRRQEQKQQKRLQNLERWIADAEAETQRLDEEMALPAVASDYKKLIALMKEKEGWEQKLEGFYEEWERLHAEIAPDDNGDLSSDQSP